VCIICVHLFAVFLTGLGAGALHTYEASHSPLHTTSNTTNFYKRIYNVISAVVVDAQKTSYPDYLIYGPYASLSTGKYSVEFIIRSPENSLPVNECVIQLDIYNSITNIVLNTVNVMGTDFNVGNLWVSKTLYFELTNDVINTLEYRVFWTGLVNVDVSVIRVREV
jgi:hypothetical protein